MRVAAKIGIGVAVAYLAAPLVIAMVKRSRAGCPLVGALEKTTTYPDGSTETVRCASLPATVASLANLGVVGFLTWPVMLFARPR
jgi:hypothetical protein